MNAVPTGSLAVFLLAQVVALTLSIFMFVALWTVYVKAGRPGWAILVPFYNLYVFLKIAGKPGWWLILLCLPLLNLIFGILALAGLAQNFGKGAGFVVGLLFLPVIFYPMLAFGSAVYQVAEIA